LSTRSIDRLAALGALATLAGAWLLGGALSRVDVTPVLPQALPGAERFEPLEGGTFAAYQKGARMGYVARGEAAGYGGPLELAVAVDEEGTVLGASVVAHRETPSFFQRVAASGLLDRLAGKSWEEPFEPGVDVDAVTGATTTSRALAEAVRSGARRVARDQLGRAVPEPEATPVRFGAPEIAVLALYAAGFVGQRRRLRYRKALRWATLLAGLFVLGFWLNLPLTISRVSSFLLGYWPQWQTNLYWYLLIGGILFIATVDNKNGYCAWFCPFGAAQECMAVMALSS
jgi:NosR/NirI family nitrous oxide reductase transcriptional regulator